MNRIHGILSGFSSSSLRATRPLREHCSISVSYLCHSGGFSVFTFPFSIPLAEGALECEH